MDAKPSLTISEDALNPNEVDWEGPDDPENPRNWPVWRRSLIFATIMSIVFST